MNWLFKYYLLSFYIVLFTVGFAQRKVACIGDSVTKGYGLKDSTESYPAQLKALLGDAFEVRNFGHSGATLLAKGHNPYIKTQAYQDALSFQPDVIVIALGLNDTDPRNWPNFKNEFFGDYSRLIDAFKKQNPQVEIYVCRLTPIFSGHKRFLSGTRDWFSQIQDLLPQIAAANEALLIDNFSPLSARIDLFADYLHPDIKGARIIAENVFKYIQPLKQALAVNSSIGSHMVLQRNVRNTIKGTSSALQEIELIFAGKKFKTTSSAIGNWSIDLPEMKAGGPYTLSVTAENEKVEFKDILIGDVYLSSGQSNMAFTLSNALGAEELIRKADNYPQVRLFKNKSLVETNNLSWDSETLDKINDLTYFSGEWSLASAQTVSNFSAVAYSAALDLHLSEKVPIGIIDISVGGSPIESWIARKDLESDNLLASYIHSWRSSDFVQDFCKERTNKNLSNSTIKNQRHPYDPSYNFEAAISHWLSTSIKAVWWYQGESNAHNMEHHSYLFQQFVKSWRSNFNQPLPIYMVQLSSINRPSWPDFRDAQRQLSNLIPHVYMAVSSDLGDSTDVHPREKIMIGKRIANLVRQHQYNHKSIADTPQPIGYSYKNDKLVVTFSNCKSLHGKGNVAIRGFQLIDEKGIVHIPTEVLSKGSTIEIRGYVGMKKVQYAYEPFTRANLENEFNTPVSTFSMDLD